MKIRIRPATTKDHDMIWNIFRQILMAGDTYAFDPQMPREEALAYWFRADTHTYVTERNAGVVGTYILRPNQSGPGSHVANAAFMVARDAEGAGVGRRMAEHCLSEARRMGFRAMQFNFVVSTNVRAIHLWNQLGFKVVGTLSGAFRHPDKGFVDVYVMYRSLL
jgi:ribosomal protein S18 acetylase RimI-like enzyme